MAGKERFTAQQFIHAIEGSRGIKSVVARRIGCSVQTVDNYLAKYKTVAEAFEHESRIMGGVAVAKWFELVQQGFWPALKLALSHFEGINDKLVIEGNLNVAIINQAVKALQDAGHNPEQVFRDLIEAAQDRANIESTTGTKDAGESGTA